MQPESDSTKNRAGTSCHILFNSRAPGSHKLDHYVEEIRQAADCDVVMEDVATREGDATRILYSIITDDLPAVLLVRDNGSLAHHWATPYLPSARDVAHYLR